MSKKVKKEEAKMNKKLAFVALLSFLALMSVLQSAKAATIPSAALDKEVYLAGETGTITVSVYNEEADKIRVTEVSATVNYYYEDGTIYVQKFFSGDVFPVEIQIGETESFNIPISLPTNVAHGYMNPIVEARTELWYEPSQHWFSSDRPTYSLKLYVESPYQQMYQDSQDELANKEAQLVDTQQELENTQGQLEEQELLTNNLNSMVIMFAATTLVFVTVTAFLGFYMFTKRPKAVQPQA
jgi:hypothetical protein